MNDLQSADQAFESAKTHYENLVNALKDARKALQAERDEALSKVKKEETGRREDKEGWRKDMKEVEERHRRILADRDQASQPGRQAVRYIGNELTNRSMRDYSPKSNLPANEYHSETKISLLSNRLSGIWRMKGVNWEMNILLIDSLWS